jgi:PEP-CTERM motif
MNFKLVTGATLALTLAIGTPQAFATVADFQLASSGYIQDSPVAGNLFESVGLLLSSPAGLVTACGGDCLSAGAQTYTGVITGTFVSPNTITPTTASSLSFSVVESNDAVISLYDSGNNLVTTLTGSGTLTYNGATAVSYFVDDLNYDGLYQASYTLASVNAVPEPSTWAMMILGFAGVGFMAYRRKSKPALMTA